MEDGKPLSAKEKRHEQIKRWQNSATDLECATYANPKTRVKFDDGAVFLAACSAGDLDEVKALLDGGANINFANVDGLTALHQACIDGNLEVVQFLVEQGADIDQEDNEGWTPLHATASCGFMDIAKYLVEKGANVGAVNSEAELAIDIAEEDDMIDYLQSVIDKQGIDVDRARDIERLVMLEDAKGLLEKYQNGEKVDCYFGLQKSGATPMHITAAKGYNDVMKILIKAGLDVNAVDNDGWTPLHAASHWSQEESAKILADKNANFKARSKLGQTCFDVADEEMLDYLEELKASQEKDAVIEEPPLEKRTKYSPPYTKDPPEKTDANEKPPSKASEATSTEEDVRVTKRTTRIASTSEIKSYKAEGNSDDAGDRYSRRNRPTSLQFTSSEDGHRTVTSTNSEGGSKPVAPTQPVQPVTRDIKENGKTSTYSRDKDTISSWRIGSRRLQTFDDESKSTTNSETRKPPYSSRNTDEQPKTARVSPLFDLRKNKQNETDNTSTNDGSAGYSRPPFTRKKPGTDAASVVTTTDPTSEQTGSSFKRSVSYKQAVGRVESLEQNEDIGNGVSRPSKTISSVSENQNEKPTDIASNKIAEESEADKRRSHLQPVADEEAEAKRRIRSRRERQTRRSTQGVTLDVYEEAMNYIGLMKTKQHSVDKADSSSDLTKSKNDSTSNLQKRDDAHSSTTAGAGTPVAALPSGYIPSDQRVKSNDAAETKTSSLPVPSINVEATASDDDKGDTSASDASATTAANRKSAAQQRRRNRSQRRSTGIPDVKPSLSSTEPENPEQDEEETTGKDESQEASKGDRLRQKIDSSSLPGRTDRHRTNVRNSDSDFPSKISSAGDDASSYSPRSRNADTQNYKKLYEDNLKENERLKTELADAQRKISELETRLEKAEEGSTRKQALDNEKRERRVLEQKLAEMEKELQGISELKNDNQRLKDENGALIRVISKLSK